MIRMYSLFDRKMREFGAVVLAPTDEACKRALVEGFRGARNSTMALYPEDFDLHCVGTFDELTGKVTAADDPTFLSTLEELVRPLMAPPIKGIGMSNVQPEM